MRTVRVTAVDYTTEENNNGIVYPLVQLTGRDSAGNRVTKHVSGTVPYFYVRREETEAVEYHDDVRRIRDGYESYDGVPLSKVEVQVPANVGDRGSVDNLTERFDKTWESDLPFYRRASIDYGLSGYVEIPTGEEELIHIDRIRTNIDTTNVDPIDPRILIADIEVLPVGGTSFEEMTDKYNCPVTHITVWDSHEDEYVCLYLDPDESVDASAVKGDLEEQSTVASVESELERAIHLRRFESERNLLSGFIALLCNRRPDLVSGWNFVDFDWDYILHRIGDSDNLSIHDLSDIGYTSGYQTERRVDCVPAFDMLSAYKKMTVPFDGGKRSYSLDYVAKEELGIGKLPDISIEETYNEDRSRMTAYNIMDVMLCVAMDREQSIHEFFYELAELSQVQIFDTFSEMRLIDGYIMSRSDDDEILPAANDESIPENAGGLVLSPETGVSDWVGVLDLKSLYPSCIITWNLSPETINWHDEKTPLSCEEHMDVAWLPDADHAEGGDFSAADIDFDRMWSDLSVEGIIPKYIKRLFPERAEKKRLRDQYEPDDPEYHIYDRQQTAVKVVMNAFYGVTSMDYWRLAVDGLGDAITSSARFALWQGKEIAEDRGYDVLYGDTDAVVVSFGGDEESIDDVLVAGRELETELNDRMGACTEMSGLDGSHPFLTNDLHGTDQHALVYEFEKLYRRFFLASKKRYAGNIVWKEGKRIDGRIDITGFESQRSDSPEVTQEIQPTVIKMILDGKEFDEISEYIQDLIGEMESGAMERYRIALPASLGQELSEYGNTQTAKACRYSNEHLGKNWGVGDDPWLYLVDKTPPMTPGTDVLALGWGEDLPDGYKINMNKTIERGLKNPLEPILNEVGWSFTELKTGARTTSGSETSGDWGEYDQTDENEWGW